LKQFQNVLIALSFTAAAASQAADPSILGASSNYEGLTIVVPTGGCVKKDDIKVEVVKQSAKDAKLTVTKIPFDACEAFFPYGKGFTFSWKELGLDDGIRLTVTNKITSTVRAK
jgi:hypothetical protein